MNATIGNQITVLFEQIEATLQVNEASITF